jgi:hypothetical protein
MEEQNEEVEWVNLIPVHNDRLVQRALAEVPQRTARRFRGHITLRRFVDRVRREARARGVHIVRDETLHYSFCIATVSDEDPRVEIWD